MQIISRFFREQERVCEHMFSQWFCLDAQQTKDFCEWLLAEGIGKRVKTSGQREYVLSYVGVAVFAHCVLKIYPKYIGKKTEPLCEMRQVLKVLSHYAKTRIQSVPDVCWEGEEFGNVLSIMLFLLADYLEQGIYRRTRARMEADGTGEILWEQTIANTFALIGEEGAYYPHPITRRLELDENDYWGRLHACIITQCSQKLEETGLHALFELECVTISGEELSAFGDCETIRARIERERRVQYDTRGQMLLGAMDAYLCEKEAAISGEAEHFLFGTSSFHVVWEQVCREVFGSQLEVELGKIPMRAPLAKGYEPGTRLKDLIEKPKWCAGEHVYMAGETFRPDFAAILDHDKADWMVILDAKYYSIQLEEELPLQGNPGVNDVAKQYLYEIAYRDFLRAHGIERVRNGFLFPAEEARRENEKKVYLELFSKMGCAAIEVIEISPVQLFDAYLCGRRMSIWDFV